MVVVVGRLNTKAGQGAEKFGKALRASKAVVAVTLASSSLAKWSRSLLDLPDIER